MKYIKNRNEFLKHLKEQKSFMKRSMKSYNLGYEDEAQRIATTIRILLHDTTTSTSLLKHLELKNNVHFLSTAGDYMPTNLLSYEGILAASSTGYYLPMNSVVSKVEGILHTFDDWWNQVILDDKVNLFSRKNIILEVANKDGGAHVDEKLNEAYANLIKNHSLSGKILKNDKSFPLKNSPVYACIWQIAFELLYSLDLLDNIKSYIRKRDSSKNYKANYIDDKVYFILNENLKHPLFKDSRVLRSEDRKHYIDSIIFLNGSRGETHIIMP